MFDSWDSMNLKPFIPRKPIGTPYVKLSSNSVCSISEAMVLNESLRDGDKISFHNDKDNKTDWYLTFETDLKAHFSKLKKPYRDNARTLVFYNKPIAKEIIKQFQLEGNSVMIQVGEKTQYKGKEFYPLITMALK